MPLINEGTRRKKPEGSKQCGKIRVEWNWKVSGRSGLYTCPSCYAELPEGAYHCPKCGAPILQPESEPDR
jgi:ribosomal protein L40E